MFEQRIDSGTKLKFSAHFECTVPGPPRNPVLRNGLKLCPYCVETVRKGAILAGCRVDALDFFDHHALYQTESGLRCSKCGYLSDCKEKE